MKLSCPKLKHVPTKNVLIFQGMELSNLKSEKTKTFLYFSKKGFPTFQDDCWSSGKIKNVLYSKMTTD